MEKLKRLIGPAPSELSFEELLQKIKARQELVAGVLQEFRERMSGAKAPQKRASSSSPKKSKKSAEPGLAELQAMLRAEGLSLEDFKALARGKGG